MRITNERVKADRIVFHFKWYKERERMIAYLNII